MLGIFTAIAGKVNVIYVEVPYLQGQSLRGVWEGSSPLPNFENMPFRRAKTAVQCTSACQFTGRRTIDELLLLQNENLNEKNENLKKEERNKQRTSTNHFK